METLAREHKEDAMPHRAIRRTLGPSPLDTAAQQRDQNILHIVEEAVRHREVRLAFQPVVQAQEQGHVAFYEGLIRVTDPTGRIIPAGQFIESIEERERCRNGAVGESITFRLFVSIM